jgi:4-coumarate--CoA ligase
MMPQNIYTSENPPILVPRELSLSQFLLKYNPDSVPADKVIFNELENPSKQLTYGSIRKLAAIGAAGLKAKLNLQPGDYVIILGRNSVDWAHLAHSLMWIGAVCA